MTLRVKQGRFGYRHGKNVLEDVSFEVPRGELLAVLGPNGVGKTTLLRCMLGLLHWSAGQTSLDGTNITSMGTRERWQRFAFVPQARNAASLALTGLDMVTIGRAPHLGAFAQPSADDIERAEAMLDRIGVSSLRDVPCGQMSGGQFQMILIARALVGEPTVLVLDEPETGLDFRNQLVVLDLIDTLVHNDGLIVVMNTHYPTHALRVADQALLLSKEHPPVSGRADDVVTPELLGRSFGVKVELMHAKVEGTLHRAVLPLSVL